ncbi:MAG TPA: hypothetical protein VMR44_07420 [Thermoanaerobaculia bacterium]|nr:hypothetical protein [Thermoanaerobaculia bacterium]
MLKKRIISPALAVCCALLVATTLSAQPPGSRGVAAGGGHLTIAGVIDVQFSFTAVQTTSHGDATGRAHHALTLAGEAIEFHTEVTCMTFDPVAKRAWIAGLILRNDSTHPSFTGEIHQPGRDIWFRVVDYGPGGSGDRQDRGTFVGFEGSAGIITSQEYCDTMPWPDDDARTNPVTEGNLQVLGG